jgi:hypothetical protein
MAGDPTAREHQRARHHHDQQQQQARLADDPLDPPVGAARQVAEQHKPGRPDEPAGEVPGQERPVGHARHARQGGHQRAQQADEAAQEHRPAALARR